MFLKRSLFDRSKAADPVPERIEVRVHCVTRSSGCCETQRQTSAARIRRPGEDFPIVCEVAGDALLAELSDLSAGGLLQAFADRLQAAVEGLCGALRGTVAVFCRLL